MDFALPEHLPPLLAEMDAFIDAEITPLERENIQYFDRRREFARTDLDNGGVPRREWEDLLEEMRRRADAAGWLRYGLPSKFGGRDGSNLDMAVIREHLAHRGLGEAASEIDVLAEALGNASPARVPRDVDHRGEGPVHAGTGRLSGCDPCAFLHQPGIPGRGLAQRQRHDGAEAVDDVAADQQRDAQAALLDGDALQLVDRIHIDDIED